MSWYMVWPGGHGGYMWPGRHIMVYVMAWQVWHCLWNGLAGMAWYLIWPGVHGVVYGVTWVDMVWEGMSWYMLWSDGHMVWPDGHGMVYGMAWLAWHSIWYGLAGNGMIYGMTWRAMAWYMVWGGRQDGIWYGLACIALCMVWPDGHGMVYVMAWRAWHGMWYGLAGITWYILWPCGYAMVYGMAWRAWHGIWYGLTGIAWYMVFHSGAHYVYVATLTEVVHSLRLRLRKPKVLLPFMTTLFICWSQFSLLSRVTPRYLLESSVSRLCPWIW